MLYKNSLKYLLALGDKTSIKKPSLLILSIIIWGMIITPLLFIRHQQHTEVSLMHTELHQGIKNGFEIKPSCFTS